MMTYSQSHTNVRRGKLTVTFWNNRLGEIL